MKRLYEFLRDHIHDYIAQAQDEEIPVGLLHAIEKDLNLLGPQLLHLVVDEDKTLSVPRKFGQGANEGSHYSDLHPFLEEHPDPIVVEPVRRILDDTDACVVTIDPPPLVRKLLIRRQVACRGACLEPLEYPVLVQLVLGSRLDPELRDFVDANERHRHGPC